jgi:spoIIIJ-associated protein
MKLDETIKKIIEDFILKTSFHVENISIIEDNDINVVWFIISTNEPHFFLGKGGEHLGAINHISKKIIENKTKKEDAVQIIIDVNDFEKKKIDSLKNIAHMYAERARFFKSSVEIDPMSAYERKIVHSYLSNKNDIKTESKGEGYNRHVVVSYSASDQSL